MRLFIMEVTSTADGTATAVHIRSNENDAKMLFHQILASAYANTAVYHALVTITDEYGNQLMQEHFARTLSNTEPES